MQFLKEEIDDVVLVRKVFYNVEKKVGGLIGVFVVFQFFWNMKQVYNVKNIKVKFKGNIREDFLFWFFNFMEMKVMMNVFISSLLKQLVLLYICFLIVGKLMILKIFVQILVRVWFFLLM